MKLLKPIQESSSYVSYAKPATVSSLGNAVETGKSLNINTKQHTPSHLIAHDYLLPQSQTRSANYTTLQYGMFFPMAFQHSQAIVTIRLRMLLGVVRKRC